jgi:hypothetical protein
VTVPAQPLSQGPLNPAPSAGLASPPPPPEPVTFPVKWLLDNASAPIQYRAISEVAKIGGAALEAVSKLPYTYPPALLLALEQGLDGTWNHSMLGVPSPRAEKFEGVGTITAFRRLLEYGWDRESPPLAHARRVLFRLLAEDEDPAYLYELAGKGTPDPEGVIRGRMLLREAAASVLAQAGYEGDPRLRGAARRIMERVGSFLKSPLAEKPFTRVANQHAIAAEATPPSYYTLQMLAYMPLFRSENYELLELLYTYLTQPLPRSEIVQVVGKKILPAPHLVLGDMLPHRNAADADAPFAFVWLELMARLGYLRRNENWSKLFDRFLDDRDAQGVWHPHKGMAAVRSTNPFVWASYPLEAGSSGEDRWADATFRLGVIARAAGRPIEPI